MGGWWGAGGARDLTRVAGVYYLKCAVFHKKVENTLQLIDTDCQTINTRLKYMLFTKGTLNIRTQV